MTNDDIRNIYQQDIDRSPPAHGHRHTARLGNVDSPEFWDRLDEMVASHGLYQSDRVHTPIFNPEVTEVLDAGGEILYPKKHAGRTWENAYGSDPDSHHDAYVDGWCAYCEHLVYSDAVYNPHEGRDLDLSRAWEDGWADAEDFYGGEPCHEA